MLPYEYIPWILNQESGSEFQSVHQTWRPRNLLFIRQVQFLLKDVRSRLNNLEMARDELQTLENAVRYIKYLQRMHLWVREAGFAWKADQIKFLQSVVGFYADYGAVLRLLRTDQVRGKFSEPHIQAITGV